MTQTSIVQVVSRKLETHPLGPEGTMASLQAVCRGIREGRLQDEVMSWTGKKLLESGQPAGNLARAKALFEAFQKQYAYMHDQRGIERIASARLTLGDGVGKAPLFPGGDCDDACVAYGSACEAAGIPVAVVGSSYDGSKVISHVLLLVSDGDGRWAYADPSAKGFRFGEYRPATRELILDPLTGEILCDDTKCSTRMAGRILNDDAIGSSMLSLGSEFLSGESGYVSDLDKRDVGFLEAFTGRLVDSLTGLREAFRTAKEVTQILGAPAIGSADNFFFGPSEYQRAVDLEQMLLMSIGAFDDVLSGRRRIGNYSDPTLGPDLFVERLASDQAFIGLDPARRSVQILDSKTSLPVRFSGGTLGAFPILGVAVAVAVCTLGISGAVIADAWSSAQKALAAAQQAATKAEYEIIVAGRASDLEKVYEARRKIAKENAKVTAGGQVKEASEGLGKLAEALSYSAVGAAVAWVGSRLWKEFTK